MKLGWLIGVTAIMAASASAAHASYSFVTVSDPNSDGYTVAQGINNAGEVVGWYYNTGGMQNGFSLTGGVYTTLDVPGATNTQAMGINAAGTIVGNADISGTTTGFTYAAGSYSPFSVPGSTATFGVGINAAGTVSGSYLDGAGTSHGFVGANTIDDNLPNGTNVTGINNAGHVVGYYIDASGVAHSFVYAGGTFTAINDPSGVLGTFATGINNLGQVVGYYLDGSGNTFGFIDSDGTYMSLSDPAGLSGTTQILGINDAGQIVGSFVDPDTGSPDGFVASPVPEPFSLGLLSFGLMALGIARGRLR